MKPASHPTNRPIRKTRICAPGRFYATSGKSKYPTTKILWVIRCHTFSVPRHLPPLESTQIHTYDTYIRRYRSLFNQSINQSFIHSFIHSTKPKPSPKMATESSSQTLWDSVPWHEWRVDLSSTGDSSDNNKNKNKPITGWQKPAVPYMDGANKLQNLHVWVPSSSHSSSQPQPPPQPPKNNDAEILSRKGMWIVYIHGGRGATH